MTAAAAAKIDPAAHLGLAVTYAEPYARRTPHLADDIHAAARLGLVEAAAIYDPACGHQFSTWAYWQCRKNFLQLFRLEKPKGHRHDACPPPRPTVSLSGPIRSTVGPDGPPLPLSSALADPRDDFDAVDGLDTFEAMLRAVPARPAALLRLAFRDGLSHREIAARLGLSQQRVTQIIAGGLAVVRERLESRGATA